MPKIKKQRKKKTYRYRVNRKRTNIRIKRGKKIVCTQVATAWDSTKSVQKNMEEMGLVYDVNKVLKIPTTKERMVPTDMRETVSETVMETDEEPPKKFVVEALEEDAKAPRVRAFRLPDSLARWLVYLIKKYGEDYKAMAKDTKNYYQYTWKQIRAKIKTLQKVPEQLEALMSEDS